MEKNSGIKLTDEQIDKLSGAQLRAIAHDRGYEMPRGTVLSNRASREAFRAAQAKDEAEREEGYLHTAEEDERRRKDNEERPLPPPDVVRPQGVVQRAALVPLDEKLPAEEAREGDGVPKTIGQNAEAGEGNFKSHADKLQDLESRKETQKEEVESQREERREAAAKATEEEAGTAPSRRRRKKVDEGESA